MVNIVYIPPKKQGQKEIIPEFYAESNISRQGIKAIECYKEAPTLAQILHACILAKEGIGIDDRAPNGEWTCDFIDYDTEPPRGTIIPPTYIYATLIRKPEHLEKREKIWYAESGERIGVLLPPDGWVLKGFDPYTGVPYQTTRDPLRGVETDFSYFWRSKNTSGLVAVNRECNWVAKGPFQVGMTLDVDFNYGDVGVRRAYNKKPILDT